ncbi:MAG TPA: hypothetical protein VJ692_15640 [Nitrospiraceae bacterium]|nr:hypothetical protein [Nitrospiraceae bacterium]
MAERVWCVKHRSGWCASKTNRPWDERSFSVPTACGYFITLPLGKSFRDPTCLECLEVLEPAATA